MDRKSVQRKYSTVYSDRCFIAYNSIKSKLRLHFSSIAHHDFTTRLKI